MTRPRRGRSGCSSTVSNPAPLGSALVDDDWESIGGLRVRVVEANAGETLAQLGQRSANRWSPEYAAVMNGLAVGERLPAGSLVKIARWERYSPNNRLP